MNFILFVIKVVYISTGDFIERIEIHIAVTNAIS